MQRVKHGLDHWLYNPDAKRGGPTACDGESYRDRNGEVHDGIGEGFEPFHFCSPENHSQRAGNGFVFVPFEACLGANGSMPMIDAVDRRAMKKGPGEMHRAFKITLTQSESA